MVRVLTDVAAIDKEFDYLVPARLRGLEVGTMVRVALGGRRRVGGWVVATGIEADPELTLRPVAHRRGWGPTPDVVELAGWAAWRWAGRRSTLLRTASPAGAVPALPPPRPWPPPPPRLTTPTARSVGDMVGQALSDPSGPALLRLPPATDLTAVVALVAQVGPTLIVVPTATQAAGLAARLRQAGAGVAVLPDEWAQARAGASVVVGARAAAWAPCPGLSAAVVLDAHDEGLHQEQNPTWDATCVVVERARRAGVPCVVISPCPTLDQLAIGALLTPSRQAERAGWPPVDIVDRRGDDPRLGLWSEPLVRLIREGGRIGCILNRTGRARLLGCRACGALARCERCGSALAQGEDAAEGVRTLSCRRCTWSRAWVCASCGSTALRQLRIGVSRAREELEALAGRPVAEVTAATTAALETGASLLVGTEALLHRGGRFDVMAFLDFDSDLLAPRFRAGEEALALLARAARLVGPRGSSDLGGPRRRMLVQTRAPDHAVLVAAASADPGILASSEEPVRRELRLPPFAALAAVSGPGAEIVVASLRAGSATGAVSVTGPHGGRWLVRAADHGTLASVLAGTHRPEQRVRIEVDPLRV